MLACGGGSGAKTAATPAAISINPTSATVTENSHQQFLTTANDAVTWFVDSVAGGNKSVGTITASGLYLAPTSTGSHTISAVSVADSGKSARATVVVNASNSTSPPPTGAAPTSGGGPTIPNGATYYSNINQMGGWSNCGACAGEGGKGPSVPYSLTQNVSSPSVDGKAAHFWIGGKTSFSDALWWKELGANANASHFVYDLYFYYTNAGAVQALEFDGNQSVGGKKYIFGHQCNVAAGQWDVWNSAGTAWVHTGISCSAPPTYTWNHLVLEYERVNGQAHFIAITLNGKKSYVNRYYNVKSSGGGELNVAFQMDETHNATNYDVWLDKVNLIAW